MALMVAGDPLSEVPLPNASTPLVQHSLPQLEAWLRQLGARQRVHHGPQWDLHQQNWSALLELEVEDLRVSWLQDGHQTVRHFPYGLPRADLQAAILAGP